MKRWWPLPIVILIVASMLFYTGGYCTSSTDIPVEEATSPPAMETDSSTPSDEPPSLEN